MVGGYHQVSVFRCYLAWPDTAIFERGKRIQGKASLVGHITNSQKEAGVIVDSIQRRQRLLPVLDDLLELLWFAFSVQLKLGMQADLVIQSRHEGHFFTHELPRIPRSEVFELTEVFELKGSTINLNEPLK